MIFRVLLCLVEADTDAANESQKQNTNNNTTPPLKASNKGLAFFGASLVEFQTKPLNSSNKTANATLSFGFDGPARNAAETVARISSEKAKLFSLVGDDVLGQIIKAELNKRKVNIAFLETEPKLPTASRIVMNVDPDVLKQPSNAKEPVHTVVQQNGEIFSKIAYKYLFPHFKDLNDTEYIFSDMFVNDNGVKALISNFPEKLFLLFGDDIEKFVNIYSSYFKDAKVAKKKDKDSAFQLGGIYIRLEQASKIVERMCHATSFIMDLLNISEVQYVKDLCTKNKEPNIQKLFYDDYQQNKKAGIQDYLISQQKEVQKAISFLHQLMKTKVLFINIPGEGILTSFDYGNKIYFTQHSCTGKCIVAENGADEAFLAGFLTLLLKKDVRYDDLLEFASYCMISSLKVESAVNPQLDDKLMKKLPQSAFVSNRIICDMDEEKKEI